MRILVTGATGFIGNYVILELLKRGAQHIVATASSAHKARQMEWFDKVTFVEHDIHATATENLFGKFGRPDVMIHLAWGSLSDFKSQRHVDEVLPAHRAFLTNLLQNGLQDLTCTGTCLEYGMREGELSEDMDCRPTIAYPIAKDLLRKELEALQQQMGFSFKWVRLFYMYGKGQTPKSILPLLEKALDNNEQVFNMSKGEQVRDYLPVTAISENIIIFAMQQKITGVINCCSGIPITIRQLVEDYLKEKQKHITLNLGYYPYTDYEPMKFWGSTKKSNLILNK